MKMIDHIKALVDYNVGESEEGTVYCAGAIIVYDDGTEEAISKTDYPNGAELFHTPDDVVNFLVKKTGHKRSLFTVEHFSSRTE
jgi:hypothetical protein